MESFSGSAFFSRLVTTAKFDSTRKNLKKTITLSTLIFLGLSCTIGCGSYTAIGYAAQAAGPSILFTFVITGAFCFFTCLPYAEFAARIPSSGFAYSYVYATCGEFMAYLVGHSIHLNFIATSALAARSWSAYIFSIFSGIFGLEKHQWLNKFPIGPIEFCIPAGLLVVLMAWLMLRGMKESTTVNNVVCVVNIATLAFAVLAGAAFVSDTNYEHFFTDGVHGVFAGTGLAFFSYLGFEGMTCFTEETINPARDLPIALSVVLGSAILVNGGIAIVMTGLAPLSVLNVDNSLVAAFKTACPHWMVGLIYIGSIAGLTSSAFANIMGQPRIFVSMASDGLLPAQFLQINKKTDVPEFAVIVSCVLCGIIATCVPVDLIGNTVSIAGVLISAFVDIALVVSRYETDPIISQKVNKGCMAFFGFGFLAPLAFYYSWPILIKVVLVLGIVGTYAFLQMQPQSDVPATFRCPLVPLFPLLGTLLLLVIAATIGFTAWLIYIVYMAIGLFIYFTYGYYHSVVNNPKPQMLMEGHKSPDKGLEMDTFDVKKDTAL